MATLPRLDPYLASTGEPLEDLSLVAASQPFRSDGPVVDRDLLAVLTGSVDGPDVVAGAPVSADGAGADVPAVLVEAGLLDADGRPTPHGRLVGSTLTEPDGRLRVESASAGVPCSLDVYLRAGWAVVLSGPSPTGGWGGEAEGGEAEGVGPGLHLDLVDAAQVPAMIAAWVGLGPAWSLATTPEELPEATVLARADDPATPPPPGADPNLIHAWGQPWILWTLQGTGLSYGRVMVGAGSSGHFALTRSSQGGGDVGFRAVPSAAVWLDLVHLVAEAGSA